MKRTIVTLILLIAFFLACSSPSGPDKKAERRRGIVEDTLDGGG